MSNKTFKVNVTSTFTLDKVLTQWVKDNKALIRETISQEDLITLINSEKDIIKIGEHNPVEIVFWITDNTEDVNGVKEVFPPSTLSQTQNLVNRNFERGVTPVVVLSKDVNQNWLKGMIDSYTENGINVFLVWEDNLDITLSTNTINENLIYGSVYPTGHHNLNQMQVGGRTRATSPQQYGYMNGHMNRMPNCGTTHLLNSQHYQQTMPQFNSMPGFDHPLVNAFSHLHHNPQQPFGSPFYPQQPTSFDQQFHSQITPVSKLEDLSQKQLLVKILEAANEMLAVSKRQHNEMISGGFKPGELIVTEASTGGFDEDFWETEEGIKVKKDITEANFDEFVRSYPIYGTPIKDEFDEESLNKLVRTCLRNVHYIARNDEIKGNFILDRYFGPNRHFDNITLQVIGDTYHMSVSKKDKILQDGFQDFSTLTSAITHISLLEDGYIDILK